MAADTPESPAATVTLRTGRRMPVIGYGTWQLTEDTAGSVAAALELGYRMIDTSGDYGTEPGVGEGIRRSGVDLKDVYVVTKVEEDEDAYESAQARLRDLGVDHVDLLLIHRPPDDGVGVELWRGLQRARDEGLTADIGVSNYSVDQLEALVEATGEVPAVNQIEWTPFGWSPAMLRHCQGEGIVIQAYSPLTRGERLDDPVVREIADAHQRTPAQVLLRWNLQRAVVPLPKAGRHEHAAENVDVFDFALEPEEMDRLGSRNERYSSLGPSLQYA